MFGLVRGLVLGWVSGDWYVASLVVESGLAFGLAGGIVLREFFYRLAREIPLREFGLERVWPVIVVGSAASDLACAAWVRRVGFGNWLVSEGSGWVVRRR